MIYIILFINVYICIKYLDKTYKSYTMKDEKFLIVFFIMEILEDLPGHVLFNLAPLPSLIRKKLPQ